MIEYYNATADICQELQQNHDKTEIPHTCRHFIQATAPYLYEIRSNQQNIMSAIGYQSPHQRRKRRNLGKALGQAAKILYGIAANVDVDLVFSKILSFKTEKQINVNLVHEKIRIVQTQISEANETLHFIMENQNKLQKNIQILNEQVQLLTENVDKLLVETTLLEQSVVFEVILNQFAYEVQNLITIINSAIHGKVHASVFSSKDLIQELREIKIDLPLGTAFPIEIDSDVFIELYKVSDVLIVQKSEYLAFVVKIPLISSDKYVVYNPIPLPIPYGQDSFIIVNPEFEYVALSQNNEKFFTLTYNQWESCIQLRFRRLCKGIQLIHHRSRSNLCEVMPLTKTTILPEMCHFKFLTSNVSIWHRLERTNSWIFSSRPDSATITCTNPVETFKIEIVGQGKLTTSTHCEVHLDNSILLPINNVVETNLDIVSDNPFKKVIPLLKETLVRSIPQRITNLNVIKNLNILAKQSIDIQNLSQRDITNSVIIKTEVHLIIIYTSILFSIIIFVSMYVKFRYRKVIYKSDLPDNQSVTDKDVSAETQI